MSVYVSGEELLVTLSRFCKITGGIWGIWYAISEELLTWCDGSRLGSGPPVQHVLDVDTVSHVAADAEAKAGEVVAA